jgi:AcrR family transcriptional regulator
MSEVTPTRRPNHGPLSGRQAEAARNDQRILDAARAVFVADPGAPIAAVAKRAGVGISALYTRYGSKEELLRTLCTDAMLAVSRETESAIGRVKTGDDRWLVLTDFMRHLADADTSAMTRAFAGKFAPTPEMTTLASRSSALLDEFFGLIRDLLRPGVVQHDLSLVFELTSAIKFASPERTAELRHRYLAVILDGLRAAGPPGTARPAQKQAELPGPPPAWPELSERWYPAS